MSLIPRILLAPAIKAAGAAIGFAAGGPVGMHVGHKLGELALGAAGSGLVEKLAEKFGEKVLEGGTDPLLESLKKEESFGLERAYRDALWAALAGLPEVVRTDADNAVWFKHWKLGLESELPLKLNAEPSERLLPDDFDADFRELLEYVAGFGASLQRAAESGVNELGIATPKILPPALFATIQEQVTSLLREIFPKLLLSTRYAEAYRDVVLKIALATKADTSIIKAALSDLDEKVQSMHEMVRALYDVAALEGKVPALQSGEASAAKDAEIARLTKVVEDLTANAATSRDPYEVKFAELIAAGNVDEALALNIETRAKTPRTHFNDGIVYDLKFDWPRAYEAFRKAWELEKNPEYGFQYAFYAQRQLRHKEAIPVYEALLSKNTSPEQRARLLNNLANLYSDVQRMKEAEVAFVKALDIRRQLAESNPDAYLPGVAMTLNNLANVYSAVQRMKEAEVAYEEALNIRRQLAESNPDAFLPDVAMTLNNLAILYRAVQRMKEAEVAYEEALAAYRQLAESNPDAYLPYVAMTLNNLAILYSDVQRMKEAEVAYGDALAAYRQLAESNPDAYLPYVAATLNNLAYFQFTMGQYILAAASIEEAESIRTPLWQENPALHGNFIAKIFWTSILIEEARGAPKAVLCDRARRAYEMTYEESTREVMQGFIDRFCVAE